MNFSSKKAAKIVVERMKKATLSKSYADLGKVFDGIASQSISSAIGKHQIPEKWFLIMEEEYGITKEELCRPPTKVTKTLEQPYGDIGEILATISPGNREDHKKQGIMGGIAGSPVLMDTNLQLLFGWINEYFSRYPAQTAGFLDDLRKSYPSLDDYINRQGRPEKREQDDKQYKKAE